MLLVIATIISIPLQLFMIFVIIRVSPGSMREYRFFLCMLTIWDMLFTVFMGLGMDPQPLFPSPITIVNGFFKIFGQNGANIGIASVIFCSAAGLFSQNYSLLYRFIVVYKNGAYKDRFMDLRTLVFSQVLILLLSFGYGWLVYQIGSSEEDLPLLIQPSENLSIVQQNYVPHKSVVLIGNRFSPLFKPFYAAVLVGHAFTEVWTLVLGAKIIAMLKDASKNFTARTYRLHLQLTALLIAQMIIPLVFIIVPVGARVVMFFANIDTPLLFGDIFVVVIPMYSTVNSMLSLAFVTPYRNYTTQVIANGLFCQKSAWRGKSATTFNQTEVFGLRRGTVRKTSVYVSAS